MAAAVGSLRILSTVRPAIFPAAMVAFRWRSLKYAGTVMTAREIGLPKNASASAFRERYTSPESSSGLND